MILREGCKHNFSKPTWVFCAGSISQRRGAALRWHQNQKCTRSSKLNLNLSVRVSERCFHTELAFIWNLFQNGYPSTLIDMLKHSVWQYEHCFQFKYLEFQYNSQTFNVGRALLSVDYVNLLAFQKMLLFWV